MTKSTVSARPRKASKSTAKRPKPHKDFPLFHHHSGRWAKKVRGSLKYFGKVADDPKGEAALNLWLDQKDDLLAGRTPRKSVEGLTIRELCNRFLIAKDGRLKSGEITARTRADYKAATDRIVAVFCKTRLVDDLASDDFESLRKNIAKTRGLVALGNEVQRVRTVFRYAFENGLIDRPVCFGTEFKRPSKKVLRKQRNGKGSRMIEADEIRAMIDTASVQLRAMILLGINCGFGNSDCGNLPIGALDLERGWVNYPRPKTGIGRRCPLWPETVAAIHDALAERPTPKDDAIRDLVFITKYGLSWAKHTADNPISKEVVKLLNEIDVFVCKCKRRTPANRNAKGIKCACGKRLKTADQAGIHREGVGFYGLRHAFETIGGEARDQVAVNYIMGHADQTMAGVYRERIGDDRLRAVVDHVHTWLFGEKSENSSDDDTTENQGKS